MMSLFTINILSFWIWEVFLRVQVFNRYFLVRAVLSDYLLTLIQCRLRFVWAAFCTERWEVLFFVVVFSSTRWRPTFKTGLPWSSRSISNPIHSNRTGFVSGSTEPIKGRVGRVRISVSQEEHLDAGCRSCRLFHVPCRDVFERFHVLISISYFEPVICTFSYTTVQSNFTNQLVQKCCCSYIA